MLKTHGLAIAGSLMVYLGACRHEAASHTSAPPSPACPTYLGQTPPGDQPRIFAPGVLSTALDEREVSFTHDGRSLFYWVILPEGTTILSAHCHGGRWSIPEVVSFASPHMDFEPFLAHADQRIYFGSTRPMPGQTTTGNFDIWWVSRDRHGFGEPTPLGPEINTEAIEFHPSLSDDGTLYFGRQATATDRSDVYRSRRVDGIFTPAQKLPAIVNHAQRYVANALIAPDGSYLLYTAHRPGGDPADADYRVSFHQPDDRWSLPITVESMGPARIDDAARLSPDGKFIFFSSQTMPPAAQYGDSGASHRRTMDSLHRAYFAEGRGGKNIYWISSSVLDRLRAQAVFPEVTGDQP